MAVDELVIDTTTPSSSTCSSAPSTPSYTPPEWLDNLFLEKCLLNYFVDKRINVISFKVAPATAKGENYASYIHRVNVVFVDVQSDANQNFEMMNLDLLIKTALEGDFAFDTLSSMNVYDKEMEFYDRIVPLLRPLLQKLNENDTTKIFANTFYVSKSNNAISFEDLSIKGYRTSTVKDGFDIVHAKMILSKLATFHGACAVLQEQQPDVFQNFQHGMINRENEGINNMYLTQLDVTIELVATWNDFDYYTEKLRRLRSKLIEKGRKAFDAVPTQFNTLIHGDIWTNNILVKHNNDTGQLENIVLIDFQFSCWTSPAMDLQYFLNTSLCETLRLHHVHELVEFYHQQLAKILKHLNYQKQVPSLQEFQAQFMEKSFYGFTSSCIVQPVMLNDNTENADFEALLVGDERSMQFKRMLLQSPIIQQNLRNLIPFYDRLGVFD